MAMLNFLVPMFSWALFYKLGMGIAYNSTRLQECLGKGHNNFLSTKIHYCSYDNPILNIFCWTWLCLFVICMSNIVDAYCLFCCGKHINKSTEKTKKMLSKEAYNNRKRYWNNLKQGSDTMYWTKHPDFLNENLKELCSLLRSITRELEIFFQTKWMSEEFFKSYSRILTKKNPVSKADRAI